jgi:hypothetical protein
VNDESDERRGYGPALVVIHLSALESTVDRNRDGNLVSMVKQLTVHSCSYVHPDGSINNTIHMYTQSLKRVLSDSIRSLTEHRRQSTAALKTSPDLHLSFR